MSALENKIAARLLSPVFWKYFAVALAALGIDVGLLYLFWNIFGFAAGAGAVSYLIGNFFQYAVSVRFVFNDRRGKLQSNFFAEYGAWLAITGVALVLTALILYLGADRMGFPVLWVKAAALPASFFTAYFLRAWLLFPKDKTRLP